MTDKPNVFVVFEPINHLYWVAQSAYNMGHKLLFISTMPVNTTPPFCIDPEIVSFIKYVDSWQERDAVSSVVKQVSQQFNVVGTYAGVESTLPYEAELRLMSNLPTTSVEAIHNALNKKFVRQALQEHQLTELECLDLHQCKQLTSWPFRGAGYFKPVNGAGSALVSRVENLSQLSEAIEELEDKSAQVYVPFLLSYIEKGGDFILEQAAEGELLSLESIVIDGELRPLGLTSRFRLDANPAVEMGTLYPYQHPFYEQIVAKAAAVHRLFEIKHGPTHTEFIVSDDGKIELVELNLRLIGSDCIETINQVHNIKFQELIVEVGMGKKIKQTELAFDIHHICSQQWIIPPPNTDYYREIVFPDDVTYTRFARKPGDKMTGNAFQLDQVASFVVRADSQEAVILLANKTRQNTLFNGEKLGANVNNLVSRN